jgi:hypothetical protein
LEWRPVDNPPRSPEMYPIRVSGTASASIYVVHLLPPGSPPSDEHIFPDAIGGTLIIDRVCAGCNHTVNGAADEALTKHTLVRMARAQLGLPVHMAARPTSENSRDIFVDHVWGGVGHDRFEPDYTPQVRRNLGVREAELRSLAENALRRVVRLVRGVGRVTRAGLHSIAERGSVR